MDEARSMETPEDAADYEFRGSRGDTVVQPCEMLILLIL